MHVRNMFTVALVAQHEEKKKKHTHITITTTSNRRQKIVFKVK